VPPQGETIVRVVLPAADKVQIANGSHTPMLLSRSYALLWLLLSHSYALLCHSYALLCRCFSVTRMRCSRAAALRS
jgi:hypothetical protein